MSKDNVKLQTRRQSDALNLAANMAKRLNSDPDSIKEIGSFVDAAEDVKRGALHVMVSLRNVYGKEMNSFPIPGSKEGNNPDAYEYTAPDANGSPKKKIGHFYTDFVRSLNTGIEIMAMLHNLNKDNPKAPEEYKTMPDVQRRSLINRWNGRMTLLKSLVTKAFRVHFMEIDIADKCPNVGLTYLTMKDKDGDEVMSNSTTPIVLFDKNAAADPTKSHVMSVSKFLNLDPNIAGENGGTIEALMNTAKRGGNEGGENDMQIATFDDVDEFVSSLAHFFDDVSADNNKTRRFYAKLAQTPASDEFLLSLFSLYDFLDTVCSKEDLKNRAAKLQAEETQKKAAA